MLFIEPIYQCPCFIMFILIIKQQIQCFFFVKSINNKPWWNPCMFFVLFLNLFCFSCLDLKTVYVDEDKNAILRSGSLADALESNITNNVQEMTVSYNIKEKVNWIYMQKKDISDFKQVNTLVLKKFASEIVKILCFYQKKTVKNIVFFCDEEKEVEWAKKMDKICVEGIKNITLLEFASLFMFFLKDENSIENLFVNCSCFNYADWIEDVELLQIGNIENIYLERYASRIIIKVAIPDKENKFKKLVVCYCNRKSVEWINDIDESICYNPIAKSFLENKENIFNRIKNNISTVFVWKEMLSDKQIKEMNPFRTEELNNLTDSQIKFLITEKHFLLSSFHICYLYNKYKCLFTKYAKRTV